MFRKLVHSIFLFLTCCTVFERQAKAQDIPTLLQYVNNMQTINPAYVGIWDKPGMIVSTKTNWAGINGAPLTQYINFSTPVKEQKSGLGISLQRVVIGQEKKLFLTGDYSYRLRIDVTHYLQLGFRGGLVSYDNNLKNYQPYPDYIPDPNTVPDVKMHNMTVFGIGAVYFSENYYFSLSVPQIIGNTFKANQTNFMSSSVYKTMYISTGYIFGSPGRVRFRPNLLVAGAKGQPVYADVAGIVYLPPVLQFGINIRSTGLVCLFSQYKLSDRLRIGYALDYSVAADISRFQLGTHEIFVGYDFNSYKRKSSKTQYF
ncbi:MAG: PorP/SprF family type IX secretion system membrane protein [Prolixibacteraceae bacterium]|jgi:type IX secretion system PorP/SprF family membrane protein